MCGNAIRCVAKYLYDNSVVKSKYMTIETSSGLRTLEVFTQNGLVNHVKVNMGKAMLKPSDIPVLIKGTHVINHPLEVNGVTYYITCISMGNPHAVVFCDEVDGLNVKEIGSLIENNEIFPERVNVEFVNVIDEKTLKMRVWERGNGETLACGTGACAAAVAAVLNGFCKKSKDIRVLLKGGELIVNYTDEEVYMTGDCSKVFEGTIEI